MEYISLNPLKDKELDEMIEINDIKQRKYSYYEENNGLKEEKHLILGKSNENADYNCNQIKTIKNENYK